MILQVIASFSMIKTSRKREGLGLALNQTKDRERGLLENQNVYQLKESFVMSNLPTLVARKTNYLAYILSDVRVIHCSSAAA